MTARVCEECMFWGELGASETGINHGVCRHDTPRLREDTGCGEWPLTVASAWCGSFQAGQHLEPEAGK